MLNILTLKRIRRLKKIKKIDDINKGLFNSDGFIFPTPSANIYSLPSEKSIKKENLNQKPKNK